MASLSQLNQRLLGKRWARVTIWFASSWRMVGLALLCMHASAMNGQAQSLRVSHQQQMTPGAIGHRQPLRSEPLREYYVQPVRLTAPSGAMIASYDGSGAAGEFAVLNLGLQVGNVYRFHVCEITNLAGVDLFPSVEVIDRLYAPEGREQEFPIPVELSRADLQLAADGKYVTRVIYIEDPDDPFLYDQADPEDEHLDEEQRYFEVPPGEDPYIVAAGVGRPVAILRIGNRAPALDGDNYEFTFGSRPSQPSSGTTFRASARRVEPFGMATVDRDSLQPNPTVPQPSDRKSILSRVSALFPLKD